MSDEVLIIVDEAGGVPDELRRAIERLTIAGADCSDCGLPFVSVNGGDFCRCGGGE